MTTASIHTDTTQPPPQWQLAADIIQYTQKQHACGHCPLASACFPAASKHDSLLSKAVFTLRPMRKGHVVYRQEDMCDSLFVIRSGAIKTHHIHSDGTDVVTGLYLPGDIFGFEGLSSQHYGNEAVCLDTTALCRIAVADLQQPRADTSLLNYRLLTLMSKQIMEDQRMLGWLAQCSAEEKVAHLILKHSDNNRRRGLSSHQVGLTMSRSDMAKLLGMALETVSRVLSRLHRRGIINLAGKAVDILDMAQLLAIAHGQGPVQAARQAG